MVRVFFPKLFKALKLRTFPAEVQQFFMGIVKQTIDFRNTNQVRRNDFIQLLLEIKNQNSQEIVNNIELTEEMIAAQVSLIEHLLQLYIIICKRFNFFSSRYYDLYTHLINAIKFYGPTKSKTKQ